MIHANIKRLCLILLLINSHTTYGFQYVGSRRIIVPRDHPTRNDSRNDLKLSKWAEDGDYDDEDCSSIPIDMRYNPNNIIRQHQNFLAIRDAGGSTVTHDVYCRDPSSSTFWFCGKIAAVSDVQLETAVSRQWPLIEEHAVRLRPIELYPKRGVLEIWCAPGDSELDVAYNRPRIQFVPMARPAKYDKEWMKTKTITIGFQGEIYNKGEEGFRTLRNDDGTPLKSEILHTTEKRAPTEEEMIKISELMKGKDIQELFQESTTK